MQLEREAIGRIKGKMRCKAKQGPRSSSRAQQPPIILQSAIRGGRCSFFLTMQCFNDAMF